MSKLKSKHRAIVCYPDCQILQKRCLQETFLYISNDNFMHTMMNYVLLFQIISAQQLPKINTEKASSIVDPLVCVEIHGVAIDKAKQKTHRIDNNGNIYLFIYLFYPQQ